MNKIFYGLSGSDIAESKVLHRSEKKLFHYILLKYHRVHALDKYNNWNSNYEFRRTCFHR